MRYFIFVLCFIMLACGNENSAGSAGDSVSQQDHAFYDSVMSAMEHGEEPGWEKFDSVPEKKIELWRKDNGGNSYLVELRHKSKQKISRVELMNDLPTYLYNHVDERFEFVQLNGTGSEEAVIRVGGFYGGATPDFAREEEQEYFFIVDVDSEKVLWKGCYVSEYYQRSNVDDSIHGEYEVGYDYKLHVKNNELIIDSLRFLDDSLDSPPDHIPGRYKWKNGEFVLVK